MTQATMSQQAADEKQALIARLRDGEREYLAAVLDVPETRAKIRPAENAWSVCEVAEHIVLVEEVMLKMLAHGSPTDAAPDRGRDSMILAAVPDRTRKRDAPERTIPTGRYASLALALEAFKNARQKTLDHIGQATADPRQTTVNHPFGLIDGYQILLIIALHPVRHAQQIAAIKSSPAYLAAG